MFLLWKKWSYKMELLVLEKEQIKEKMKRMIMKRIIIENSLMLFVEDLKCEHVVKNDVE